MVLDLDDVQLTRCSKIDISKTGQPRGHVWTFLLHHGSSSSDRPEVLSSITSPDGFRLLTPGIQGFP